MGQDSDIWRITELRGELRKVRESIDGNASDILAVMKSITCLGNRLRMVEDDIRGMREEFAAERLFDERTSGKIKLAENAIAPDQDQPPQENEKEVEDMIARVRDGLGKQPEIRKCMQCAKCGRPISFSWSYCCYCGAKT